MKHTVFIYIFGFSFLVAGCKDALSTSPNSNPAQTASSANGGMALAKDEPTLGGAITTDLAMNDSLMKNGFTVFSEQITNFSGNSMEVSISYSSPGYRLFTRIQEHFSAILPGNLPLNVSPTKLSTLNLILSELVVNHSDGTSQRIRLDGSSTQFTLAANEKANLAWIIRGTSDAIICPFYTNFNPTQIMGSTHGDWALLGSSMTGDFNRTIQAQLQNPDGTIGSIPLVTGKDTSTQLISGNGVPLSSDIDFGCNGFMQSMN